MMRVVLLFLVAMLAAGCGARSVTIEAEPDFDDRFVGLWAIELDLEHLYHGTLYNFSSEGELIHLRDTAYEGGTATTMGMVHHVLMFEGCMGTGMGCPIDIYCAFGSSWWSFGDDILELTLDCDDSRERTAHFLVSSPPEMNTLGAEVVLDNVDGEGDWFFGVDFRKCPSHEDCLEVP